MKLNKWLFGAAAALMLGACSDNFADGPDGPNKPEEGDSYIGINIQLPSVSATRADDTTKPTEPGVGFDDGEESEYYVKDAVLVLFEGTTERNAKYVGSFNLQEAKNLEEDDSPQVTRHSIRIASVGGFDKNDTNKNLYASVMCNGIANGMYTLNNPKASWMNTNMTIVDFQKQIQKNATSYSEGTPRANVFFQQQKKGQGYASTIFMTNAPLSTKSAYQTTESSPITDALPVLVELDKTLYKTPDEALKNPAGVIHVERAVGKVTCSDFNTTTEIVVTIDGVRYKLEATNIWWDLAQDMADSYIVRNTNRNPVNEAVNAENFLWKWYYGSANMEAGAQNRMLGNIQLLGNKDQAYYRSYFCQVPGYNVKDESDELGHTEKKNFCKRKVTFDENNTVKWSNKNAFYPLENTFPVEYMKYANTTRVVFWVDFTAKECDENGNLVTNGRTLDLSSKNFYIKEVNKNVLYLDDKDGNDPLTNAAIASLTKESNRTDPKMYKDLWDAIKAAVNVSETEAGNINVNLVDLLDFEYEDTLDGSIEIKSISFKTYAEVNAMDNYQGKFKRPTNGVNAPVVSYDFSEDLSDLNSLGQYFKYDAGRALYEVRIKHFGDDLTPWEPEDPDYASTIDESYGENDENDTRNKNYLGRYGIVRNNWYDLNVKNILSLGDPQDPARWDSNWPGKPDDNKNQYIAVKLRVLSWAKRNQEVNFE